MYQIVVPVTTFVMDTYGAEKTIKMLRKAEATRVFLCPPDTFLFEGYGEALDALRRNTAVLHAEGFEVGCWVWTFRYNRKSDFTYMKSPTGNVSSATVCPSDPAFRAVMGKFVQDAARCGIDLFQFDDDYRYGFQDMGFGCCCDNHLKMISEILDEKVELETLKQHLLFGGKNKYRSAFLQANGRALEEFAAEMRRYLDEVNPAVRMGFCSCITSWDIDGTHPDKIAKLLAGNTKPFYRLIGAPYWANGRCFGCRLADVIELERAESARRMDKNIEIFSEGDTYPRPRYRVPAAFSEGFDTALRVAGCTDGILKYVLDYTASPDYETGYVNAHQKNRPLYREIDRIFGGKTSTGIRVWDKGDKFGEMVVPKAKEGDVSLQDIAFSPASKFIGQGSLPSIYEGMGTAGIAFGEDVLAVPPEAYGSGLILDLRAAQILGEKGVDTGLIGTGEVLYPKSEYFVQEKNYVGLGIGVTCKKTELSANVQIESYFEVAKERVTGSYRYENAKGQRFLVFCFDAYFNGEGLWRQYTRPRQIAQAAEWLCGEQVPAVCFGNPDLYMQVKEETGKLAVGLWNFFPDPVEVPTVTLAKTPKSVAGLNCTAKIEGNTVILSPLTPYGFAAFEVIVSE